MARNIERFYYEEFERAVQLFDEKQSEKAADICCELGEEFLCPRIVQVQALQLRSNCTQEYWPAQEYLQKALELLESLEDGEDELVRTYTIHTKKMIRSNEAIWLAFWKEKGRPPPAKSSAAPDLEKQEGTEKEAGIEQNTGEEKREVETAWRNFESMTLGDETELPVLEEDHEMSGTAETVFAQHDRSEWAQAGGSSPAEGRPGGAARPWERDPPNEGAPTGLLSPFSDFAPGLLTPEWKPEQQPPKK